MLPVLGSSTLRDAGRLPVDYRGRSLELQVSCALAQYRHCSTRVDQRATVLDASNLMEEAALDRYEFVRDAYLQRRESKVFRTAKRKNPFDEDDIGPTSCW